MIRADTKICVCDSFASLTQKYVFVGESDRDKQLPLFRFLKFYFLHVYSNDQFVELALLFEFLIENLIGLS